MPLVQSSVIAIVLTGVSCTAAAQSTWWYMSADDGLFRIEADGSSPRLLADNHGPNGDFQQLAADPVKARVYEASPGGGTFSYTDLNGQNRTDFSPPQFPQDIAVDDSGRLFAAQSRRIYRIEQGVAIELTFQSPGVNRGIAIDNTNDFIYWTRTVSTEERNIYRSRMDGSAVELVIRNTNTVDIGGVALTPNGDRMFWTLREFDNSLSIWTALSDGSEAVRLAANLGGLSKGLVVNPLDGMLYWVDQTDRQIFRMQTEGSGLETFFDARAADLFPHDISLYIAPSPGTATLTCSALLLVSRRRRQADARSVIRCVGCRKPLVHPV